MIEIRHGITGEVLYSTRRKSLRGIDLSGANLTLANLSEAKLSEANLRNADLTSADMRNARLIGADLIGARLSGADLSDANLGNADLTSADLRNARLIGADLIGARLSGADLTGAVLICADLSDAILRGADLSDADLVGADLSGADLRSADLTAAKLSGSKFIACETLADAKNLDQARHFGPSAIDHVTLRACIDRLPDVFLESCGYTQFEIGHLRTVYKAASGAIRFYSCFISHGEPDLPFAERLLVNLRQNNVTCWHYKDYMRPGDSWRDQVDRAIKVHDKLVLVCSARSAYRDNVVHEILRAIDDERETGRQKLFPVRLDDHIFSKEMGVMAREHEASGKWRENWVAYILKARELHIPDFSCWEKDDDKYRIEFRKLLQALQSSEAATG